MKIPGFSKDLIIGLLILLSICLIFVILIKNSTITRNEFYYVESIKNLEKVIEKLELKIDNINHQVSILKEQQEELKNNSRLLFTIHRNIEGIIDEK